MSCQELIIIKSMEKPSPYHSLNISPWHEGSSEEGSHYERALRLRVRRATLGPSSDQRRVKSENKGKPNRTRTVVPVAKINIANDRNFYPVNNQKVVFSLTPKGNRVDSWDRMRTRESADLNGSRKVTLESWREENRRLLSKMIRKQPGWG